MRTCRVCKLDEQHVRFTDKARNICAPCEVDRGKKRDRENALRPMSTSGAKICTKCQTSKSVQEYAKSIRGVDGRSSICRACKSGPDSYYQRNRERLIQKEKDRYQANPELKVDQDRCRKYGVTLEWLEEKRSEQENRCAVCGKPPKRSLHVDHDHATGEVRDLLCHGCNTALGMVNDSIETLESLITYLRKHESVS